MSEGLKPCPHCGGKPELFLDEQRFWRVKCTGRCDTITPRTPLMRERECAIWWWNTEERFECHICPKCWSTKVGVLWNNTARNPEIGEKCFVQCDKCGERTEWYSRREEAIAAWNRRADDA